MSRPEVKRVRLQSKFDEFHDFSEKERIRSAYRSMLDNKIFSLVADKITYCDASAENGKSFSRADCHATPQLDEFYAFESIFKDGVAILNDLTAEQKYEPTDDTTQALVLPLIKFLLDKESHEILNSLNDGMLLDQTQLMISLGTHFFSKLAVGKDFSMDKTALSPDPLCICGNCEKKEIISKFDDTSIGNKNVWHGNVDIMLDSCEIGVHCARNKQCERTMCEIESRDLRSISTRNQILSQAITFSFLQRQRHPASDHFMIPSIVTTTQSIQIFFYDSKNDILLETKELKLFYPGSNLLNYQAIIYAWLVINYKYLCSGPTTGILKAPKSEFPSFAGNVLCIYQSDLKYRKVTEEKSPQPMPWWVEVEIGMCNDKPLIKD